MDTNEGIGSRLWAIPEGYMPGSSTGPDEMKSHETICFLNTSNKDAKVEITAYFADREPAGPYEVEVGARRTVHLWVNDLEDPEPIPTDTDYATVIRSNVPIVVQHTRLDSRQAANALLSTMAYPVREAGGS
ncbi:MAG: sensory rhodopsin transducer [Gemmatimonadales bacterium]|nr:MAG: sensory rhodopsin transducer [Gemmatimonadales bacterium]